MIEGVLTISYCDGTCSGMCSAYTCSNGIIAVVVMAEETEAIQYSSTEFPSYWYSTKFQ